MPLPFNSIKLASYDFLRRNAGASDATSLPAAQSAVFGAAAGVVAATSCFPLEMVRRRQMMGEYVGLPFHAAMLAISQKEGASALLRGSGVNIVKVAQSWLNDARNLKVDLKPLPGLGPILSPMAKPPPSAAANETNGSDVFPTAWTSSARD